MTLGLIIAEKPDVAKKISSAVNTKSTRCDGYFKGDKYITTFLYGHMYELFDAKEYDPRLEEWNRENYPFIPNEFRYKEIDKDYIQKQVKVLKKLVHSADIDYIIIATDGELEGQLIAGILIKELKMNKPLKRLWINSHTPIEVRNGMKNLKDYSEYKNYEIASFCRQHMDWIVGINYTVLSTISFGYNSEQNKGHAINVGRVILPTLKLIYDREKEINEFIKEPYYELKAIFKTNKQQYEAHYMKDDKNTKFQERESLENVKTKLDGKYGVIVEKEGETIKETPPLLFNLTDLQGYISSKYDIFSDETKKIAQELYDDGYISYPRTASRHLDETQDSEVEKVLEILTNDYPSDYNIKFKKDNRIFDSSKVDSHPALTPTYIIPSSLNEKQSLIYEEIKKRFIAAFMQANEYDKTTFITDVEGHRFITKEKILVKEGWMKLYKDDKPQNALKLNVKVNDISKIEHLQILDKETEPPKRYSEKSLFSAMEFCGRKVSEDDFEHILKGYQIGTADSRSTTVTKLLDLGYVERKGKSLTVTQLGKELVEVFPVKELLDTDFTGRIQKSLKDIEKGFIKADVFMDRMKAFVINNSSKFVVTELNSIKNKGGNGNMSESLGRCPECSKDVFENKNAYSCSGYKEGCKFAIWKSNPFLEKFNVKSIDKKMAKLLIENPEGIDLRINSTLLHAKLTKNGEYHNISFEIKDGEQFSLGACPKCGKKVIINSVAYSCEDKECNFVIWKKDKFLARYSKKPTEAMVKALLSKGEVIVKGMNSPNGKGKFDCTLRLKENGKYWGWDISFNNNNNSKAIGK